MRRFRTLPYVLTLLGVAGTAHAQSPNTYQTTWSALSPGNDWAGRWCTDLIAVIRSPPALIRSGAP